jgi:serine/threonine protein kinase
MFDLTGQQCGNYHLIQLLTRGAMTEVYLGEDIDLKTRVALKIPHRQSTNEALDAFVREARMVASFSHPHIVPIWAIGKQDGTPYVAMEYAPGGSLREHRRYGTRIALHTVVSYVQQIAAALQYVHDRGMIHRNIKPSHLLVGTHGEIRLTGFDAAIAIQSGNSSQIPPLLGNPRYVAPEQFIDKPHPTSDQYSLALIVYEWLSGEVPFSGPSAEMMVKRMTAPAPSLQAKVPEIPPEVEEVVTIALHKDVQQRFQSLQAFAKAFEQASRQR